MTTPRDPSRADDRAPNGGRPWVGAVVMAAVVAVAAFVFLRQPGTNAAVARQTTGDAVPAASAPTPRERAADSAQHAIGATGGSQPVVESLEPEAARALALDGPVLSPSDPFPDTLQFDADYRARQARRCSDNAAAAVSSGGQGIGTAGLKHAGMVGDSLAFDGVARSTTSRAMVWRCTFSTRTGSVGQMTFTPADSVPGLVLEWNAIATLDDTVLRRCLVRAQSLFTDKTVLLRATGRRRDDQVRLVGVAEGGGVSVNWSCGATVRAGAIATLDARVGG